jgi:hypothetical protein
LSNKGVDSLGGGDQPAAAGPVLTVLGNLVRHGVENACAEAATRSRADGKGVLGEEAAVVLHASWVKTLSVSQTIHDCGSGLAYPGTTGVIFAYSF